MDLSAFVFPGMLLWLGVNQFTARLRTLAKVPGVIWAVNLINVAIAGYAFFAGLPGFEQVRPANWMIGLLFLMHTAKNVQFLADQRAALREERLLQAELAERERLRQAEDEA